MTISTKQCNTCQQVKTLDKFSKTKTGKTGRSSTCKQCKSAYDKQYRENNKDKIQQYKQNNKTKLAKSKQQSDKKYYEKNKDKILQNTKEYAQKNKEKLKRAAKIWKSKNIDAVRQYKNQWQKNKRIKDPLWKLRTNLSRMLSYHLQNINESKNNTPTFQLLGFTKQEFEQHFLQFLNKPCQRCGNIKITIDNSHIDHIIPLITAKTREDVIRLNQLKNLRLICVQCNLKKGAQIE